MYISNNLAAIAMAVVLTAVPFSDGAAQSVKILAVGDSITEGISGEKSYRDPLTVGLSASGCSYQMVGSRTENLTPTGFVSPHEGYSGHRVDFFTEGSPDGSNPGIVSIINAQDPDVFLIHLGSNDMNVGQPVTGAYLANGWGGTIAEMDVLVTQIWNANASAEIFVANVIPWFGGSSNVNIATDIQALGAEIESWVASENDTRLHLVDVKSGFISNYMQGDGIHPNASGDSHIADAFIGALEQQNICPDTAVPTTSIASPVAGETVSGTHTFSGSATDLGGSGFDKVRIAIENDNYTSQSDRWWNFGTSNFGSYDETIANLSGVTISNLDWDITVSLPSGNFTLYALSVDNSGNQDYYNTGVWPTNRQFTVVADNQPPTTAIVTPDVGSVLDSNNLITFSGNATDTGGAGFYAVRLRVLNLDSGQFELLSNNSDSISATLTKPSNLNNTNWNYSYNLDPGSYRVLVRTIDNAGNANPWVTREFSVSAIDLQAPKATIVAPGTSVFAGAVTFAGNATESGGSGFASVRVRVRDTASGQFVTLKNGKSTISAVLSKPGDKNNTNWAVTETMSAGTYRLFVSATDQAGNQQAWAKRDFTVSNAPDNQAPVAVVVSPTSNSMVVANTDFVISGNATDTGGSGFSAVRLRILNNNSGQWEVLSNGSIIISAALTKPNNKNNTNWNYIYSLPAGSYRLFVAAIDKAGNQQPWVKQNFTVQ